jgi:hypothetical protein
LPGAPGPTFLAQRYPFDCSLSRYALNKSTVLDQLADTSRDVGSIPQAIGVAMPTLAAGTVLPSTGLKTRIQGLRSKTTDNGCTEAEALLAAAKVAELLDRYDLSLTDVDIRAAPCKRCEYENSRKKRVPLDGCIGAVADFCDCRVLA